MSFATINQHRGKGRQYMNVSYSNSNLHIRKENIDVGSWIRFIRHLGLPKMFASLQDPRCKSHTTYSLSSLVMWAFSLCSFRQPSKHAMQTSIQYLSPDQQVGVSQLLGSHQIPHSSTVDHALAKIDYDQFNTILLQLFDQLNKNHFFYNHQELTPNNIFYIGADGFWTHTYTTPHAVDEKGVNSCPYCLPRKHHAGTDKEFTTWVHICVTFTLICEGITLPLYVYPLKAVQVNTDQTDGALKQECELLATKIILPLLKKHHPRLLFVFLGDALYANKPFIQFLDSIGMGYIIVLKDNTLKNLHRKCNDLAKTDLYQRFYTHEDIESIGGKLVHRETAWFNHTDLGEGVYTNVLRFKEEIEGSGRYEGMWICSEKLSKNNCFKRAQKGRLRWNHEDLHNSCKNRGFDAKHDMARADPNLLMVWKLLLFIAFFVFEIFRCSTVAAKARHRRSWMKFAQDMLEELIYIDWERIEQSPMLQKPRVQFRFNFGGGP